MKAYLLRLRKILLSNYFYIVLILITLLVSIVRIVFPRKSLLSEKDKYFYGTVIKYNIVSDKLTIYLKNKETVIGTYYFKDNKEISSFRKHISLGDKLIVKATFTKPYASRTENTFNYQKYLANKQIYFILNISNYKIVSKNKSIYYKIKNYIRKRVKNNPYLNTFLLGDKSYFDKEVVTTYQEIGISHLFAISGMHISILSGLLLKILSKSKKKYLIVSLFLLLYLLMIDVSPSAIRGVLFFILFSLNKVFNLNLSAIKIFIFTLVITLLINSFYLFDLGFLYSFSISFSLLFLSKELKTKNYFKGLLKVSILSFLISIPISLYNFYQLNFLSIFYNLFFVPFISLLLFPLELLRFFCPFLSNINSILIDILENTSLYLSKISILKFIFSKVNIFIYFIYFLLIIVFLFDFKKSHKRRFLYLFLFLLIIHYFYIPNNTFIKMLDVGQGDSILIYSKGEATLVDTGGIQNKDATIVRSITIPVLKSLGVKKIKNLVITHGDYDHIGEAKYLKEHFRVENIFINNNEINYYEKELLKYKAKIARKGLVITCGEISLIQLNKNMIEENDSSSVYLGVYKNKSFLLMGDASIKTEEYLLKNYNLNNITILKVGHHGSRTSSEEKFLKIVEPKISLISAGVDNKFNHPHKDVLDRLKDISKVFVTKDLGTITVDLDTLKVTK